MVTAISTASKEPVLFPILGKVSGTGLKASAPFQKIFKFKYLLAQVTYNQVWPLRINYLTSSHRGNLNTLQH